MIDSDADQFEFVWDCREASVQHSPMLWRKRAKVKPLPNYASQLSGEVAATVCRECRYHLPGCLINRDPNSIDISYFQIEDAETLFVELPDGYAASGASRKRRQKLVDYSMADPYNPGQGHAGKTLKYATAYQKDFDEWKPD